jgi:hypothetical protein
LVENSADDDKYLSQPTSAELGDIRLEIKEVMVIGKSNFMGEQTLPAEPDKIHERSKKAIGHRFGWVRLHVR